MTTFQDASVTRGPLRLLDVVDRNDATDDGLDDVMAGEHDAAIVYPASWSEYTASEHRAHGTANHMQLINGELTTSEGTARDASTLERTRLVRLREQQHRRFRVLQQWEGEVLDIDSGEMVARLRNLTDAHSPDEVVSIPIREFRSDERSLIEIGTVFYWTIGFNQEESGQLSRVSEIRMRRLQVWTKRAVGQLGQKYKSILEDTRE